MTSQSERPVLVAGAGPVGVIAALALARQGLRVHVFEAEDRVNEASRAATTHAATLEMLAGLGLIDDVIRHGLIEPRFRFWDRSSGEMMAEFDFGVLKNDTPYPFVVQCEQHKLAKMAIERLRIFADARIEFCAEVASLEQFDDHVEIMVKTRSNTRRVAGSYLIGADGGRSTVRKVLGIEFEGYTHPERFLVATTTFDFGVSYDGCSRNYFSDPDEWCALFKVAGDDGRGLWRVLFPTRRDETGDLALDGEAIEQRLQNFFPKSGLYPVVHGNLYKIHQRVATTFRKGRTFLAGDAAHINNPLGGLGLNFGIHDAIELSELLGRVIRQEVPAQMLDHYDRHRRPLNLEYVQQQTIENKKRMEDKNPKVRAANFDELRKVAADPAAHRAYLLRASLIESVRRSAADSVATGAPSCDVDQSFKSCPIIKAAGIKAQ
jgi:3-(3-hydroxy-phenyl)propionate hydroxylase